MDADDLTSTVTHVMAPREKNELIFKHDAEPFLTGYGAYFLPSYHAILRLFIAIVDQMFSIHSHKRSGPTSVYLVKNVFRNSREYNFSDYAMVHMLVIFPNFLSQFLMWIRR